MSTKKLNKAGLSQVWDKVFELVKKVTGDVEVSTKGTLQEQINRLSNAETQDNTVAFVSEDAETAENWTDVPVLISGEKHSSIFHKISVMFKNIRYLYANQEGLVPVDPLVATKEGFPADAYLTGLAISEQNRNFENRLQMLEYVFENTNPIVTKTGTDTCSGPIGNVSKMYTSVVFDEPFMGIPTVTVTKTSTHKYCSVTPINITQSGFTLEYYNYASASEHNNITNITCTWIAEWALKSDG